ncbi:Transcriptional activator of proteases prtT [Talaromyces islandicus]|uniref:Transcriptional activator of proteases prtT n=1 Tax=Talaromyces islandicus TaxID=28573 RepID=A0A0U1LSB4_TALIS|nr:Transcriptional activator of proteases prtT [Talaromyces islandicus]
MPTKRQRRQADTADADHPAGPPQFDSTSFINRFVPSSTSTAQANDDERPNNTAHKDAHPAATPMPPPGRDSTADSIVFDALPGITRKITACAACRKNKIKCDMPSSGPPCTRCRRRSLSCVLNRSLQSLLEDTKNTDNLKTDIQNIHKALTTICQHLELELPDPLVSTNSTNPAQTANCIANGRQVETGDDNDGCEVSPPESPSAPHAPIDTFLTMAKIGRRPSGSSQQSRKRPDLWQEDLVSKSIITITVAESLLERYFSRLDHYLYGIAVGQDDIQKLRFQSPVLFAAICTVSAIHDTRDSQLYETCNRELRQLVSRSMFEKRDVNYIRALCVSSFWLPDASRILSSDAIRRAADIRLHSPAAQGNQTGLTATPFKMTDRLRLWYLLFICDQHLSILHNRDALLRGDKAVTADWESYIQHPETTQDDIRILSQVSLLLIMSEIRDTLGSEFDSQMPQVLFGQITNYSRQLDRWFSKFSALFQPNPQIAEFPRKGLELHYQFGKLYLGHHVFRNLQGQPIPSHSLTAAIMAHDAAVTIFDMILTDTTLQGNLVGVPHYFHIMIAFAGNFLLEICKNYYDQLSIEPSNDFALVEQVLALFQATPCIAQHPIQRMTVGLGRKLYDCASSVDIPVGHLHNTAAYGAEGHMQKEQNPLTSAGGMQIPQEQLGYSVQSQVPVSQTTPDDFFLFSDLNFGFTNMTGLMGME